MFEMEKWIQLDDFQDYEISNYGRIRRITPEKATYIGRVLKPTPTKESYLRVGLYRNGVQIWKLVHVLVAEKFIPNPNNLPEVNHKDGNKSNCLANNLEWRTTQGNRHHAVVTGLSGKGVHFNKKTGKWVATFSPFPHQRKYLGLFITEQDAIDARQKAIKTIQVAE